MTAQGEALDVSKKKTVLTLTLVVVSVLLLALAVLAMVANDVVTPQVGLLMLVALLGLYVGFGILIAVYRLIAKLE